jgi:Outer membrane protein beta-barrel domain
VGIGCRVVLLLTGLSLACASAAQDEVPAKANLFIGAGSFEPDEDSALSRRDGDFNFDVGFGWRLSRHFGWELGWLYYNQGTAPPAALRIGGTGSDEANLNTSGLNGMLKVLLPAGPFDFFAGAGLGYYKSELSVTGANFLTFQSRTVSRSDRGWAPQYLLGFDLRTSPRGALTLQYRRVDLEADFGPGIGYAKVGGRMWQLLFRAGFGPCTDC